MSQRPWRVVTTPTAASQMGAVAAWWRENRPAVPDRFLQELELTVDRLATLPNAGARYEYPGLPDLRRVLLPVCRYHVYYSCDEREATVTIHAVWHSARGSGPELE